MDKRKERKVKTDYPYILYIHKGQEIREVITRAEWNLFLEKLQVKLIDLALEGKAPKVDWTGFKNGVGVVATIDADSRSTMMNVVADTKVAEISFRAWPKGEKERHTIITIKIPHLLKNFTSGKLVQAMEVMNKLVNIDWKLFSCRDIPSTGGERLLRMVVGPDAMAQLEDLDGYLYLGTFKLEARFVGRRIGGTDSL